jgi:MraZ protein
MPKRFRDRMAITQDRTVWITNALDGPGHLEVRPASSFEAFLDKVSKVPATKQIMEFRRYYFGAALEVEVDGAGRILVPAPLRARIGLTDKISFVGAGRDYFEIWNPDALENRFADIHEHSDELLSHLAEVLG